MSHSSVIKIHDLCRNFGKQQALRHIELAIAPGSVIGVLGPNGCGKTTLLKHIIGMLVPTQGTVETFGAPACALEETQVARIGYVSQQSELVDWLTVGETINFFRAHFTAWDHELCARLLKDFSLDESKGVGGMSVGQKQRLSILLAVCHRPDLLILDEPAASLDPVLRQDFLDLLMELIQDPGRTILISSHILTDVQKVIDKVLILNEGQVHCFQDLDELREEYYRVTLHGLPEKLPTPLQLTGLVKLDQDGSTAIATIHNQDHEQLELELAHLNCQTEWQRLDFEEIYRLIVTGK